MFNLAINTGFAVNRYSEPEEWIKIVGRDLDLRRAQMTADMLNPSLTDSIIDKQILRIEKACNENDVEITSLFTGAFTRVNHIAHPDEEVREFWVQWFKRFIDIGVRVGATRVGSHFGIFTMKDDRDLSLREERRAQNIQNWHRIGEYAKEKGLECLTWEPMSISREQGETIYECRKLQEDVNKSAPLPFKICLDVDHGDWSSGNPDDTDPYVWLREFAEDSPQVHLKQTLKGSGGNYPFLSKYNEKGKIVGDKVIRTLEQNGCSGVELILEHCFREREPMDSIVIEMLKESVDYWKKYLKCKF